MDVSTGDSRFTFVVLGRTGHGKSSTANSLLGREAFKSLNSLRAVTDTCRLEQSSDAADAVAVIDTPGLCEHGRSQASLFSEIKRCVGLAGPHGVDALVLVLSLTARITTDDIKAFESLSAIFGPSMLRHSTIVWTHGHELKSTSTGLDEFLEAAPSAVSTFVKEAAGGSMMIENRQTMPGRINDATEIIRRARAAREEIGYAYTAEALQAAQAESNVRAALHLPMLGKLRRKQCRRVRQALMATERRNSQPEQAQGFCILC